MAVASGCCADVFPGLSQGPTGAAARSEEKSKLAATEEALTVGGAVRQADGPCELVPIVTVAANAADANGVLLDLAQRIQALIGDLRTADTSGVLIDLARRIHTLIGDSRGDGGGAIEVSELRIDVDAHRVTVGGEEVVLTALEFKLLVMLASRRERVQPRGRLLSEVWSCSPQSKTRTVDTHVKRLREKLRSAARFIRTIRGTGYIFTERASTPDRWSRDGSRVTRRSPIASLRSAAGAER